MLFVASLPNTCTVKVPFPALAAPPLPCYCALLVVTRSTATKQSTQHPEACIQTVHQTFLALFTFNVLAQKQHLDTRFNCSQWEKQKKYPHPLTSSLLVRKTHSNIVFPDHPPEVDDSVRQWTLSCNIGLWAIHTLKAEKTCSPINYINIQRGLITWLSTL